MKPKKKTFVMSKRFRFLPGSVRKLVNEADLKQYNEHRRICFHAGTKVDVSPARAFPHQMLNVSALRRQQERLMGIQKENRRLLKKINLINRHGGDVDTCNHVTFTGCSRLLGMLPKMQETLEENKAIYKRLLGAESVYKKSEFDRQWKEKMEVMGRMCKYPIVFEDEDEDDLAVTTSPSLSSGLLLPSQLKVRPCCFLDFKVHDGIFLGRIIVELYHEYVPVTVQNFLEICKGTCGLTYKDCPVHRIVQGKFMETGDITLGTGRGGKSVYGDSFQEENHVLKHRRAGVLSMKRIQYKTENNSQFCISFRAIEELDHKNVVFGKVIRGNKAVFKIEAYGRKIGKPHADVRISNCGELKLQSSGNSRRRSSGSMAGRKRSGSMQISYEDQKQQKNTTCCTLKNCCVPNKV